MFLVFSLPCYISGLVLGLGYLVEDMMVTVCWVRNHLEGWMKFVKFVELAAGYMLAITNLAICVNLALIIWVSNRQCLNSTWAYALDAA